MHNFKPSASVFHLSLCYLTERIHKKNQPCVYTINCDFLIIKYNESCRPGGPAALLFQRLPEGLCEPVHFFKGIVQGHRC